MIEFCSSARCYFPQFPQFPQFRDGSAHRSTWLRNEDLTQESKIEALCASREIKRSSRLHVRGAAQQKAFTFWKHLRFPQFRDPEIVEIVESPDIVEVVETSNQSNIYIVPNTIKKYFRSLVPGWLRSRLSLRHYFASFRSESTRIWPMSLFNLYISRKYS